MQHQARIEKQVFDKPSGNVRGVATLHMTFGKKEVRVGHAYLMAGSPAELSVDKPRGKLSIVDVRRMGEALVAFADEVASV